MSKKTYEALPGVEWVNGQPVPENREMKLSAAEAKFDLAQGRIQLKDTAEGSAEADVAPVVEAEAPAAASEPRKKR